MEEPLYFIAIIPDEEIYNEVHKIKEHAAECYKSKAALKSPPHITLYMPFRWRENKIERLFTVLREITSRQKVFSLTLSGFDTFPPRVIFIDIKPNENLDLLQSEVVRGLKRQLNLIDKGFEERPYHPHITVAFRDLKKDMFKKAWDEEFKFKGFSASFKVESLTLLKHNGRKWEAYKKFPLVG